MFESAAERAGLDADRRLPAAAGARVRRPRALWAKIVLNLLSNALKFTFEGGITVRAARGGRARRC